MNPRLRFSLVLATFLLTSAAPLCAAEPAPAKPPAAGVAGSESDAKKPVVISKLCQDDSGKDVKWIGVLCLLFWLGMVIVRWHRIARPSRELLRTQITSLRAELETLPAASQNGTGLGEIGKLLDAARDLIDREKGSSGYGIVDFLFWSRGQEISGWGYVHEAERQMVPFLADATVRVRLEGVEQRLRLATDAPCLALADAIQKDLAAQPADELRLRALLAKGLDAVYGREDNGYANLVSWQNKTSWLVGCGLVLILVLAAATQHHAILLLVGAVGGLLSRLSRSLDRKDVPTDYGASWTTLFLSPVAGALGAWAGLLVMELAKELSVLGSAFTTDLANPCEAKTLAIALVFGFSERLLDGVLDKVVGKSGIDQSTTTNPPPAPKPGAGNLAISDLKLPDGTVGTPYPAVKLTTTGAVGNVKWSLTQGALPTGLQLGPDDGSITGTPTAAGVSTFTVQVTDQKDQKTTASLPFKMTVK